MDQATKDNQQLELIPLDENTPRLKVAKANALIEAQYELTIQQHKLLLLAMAQIRKNQTELHEQVFSVQEVCYHCNINEKNAYRDLKRIAQGLMRKQVEIQNEETGEWRMYQWVSKSYCERGNFGIKFSNELAPFLLNLVGRFTMYELGRILRMQSNYSVRLYELIKQYERFGVRTVSLDPKLTAKHDWDNFPKVMGYDPASYSRFSNLNQRVLKPAIKGVEENTEFKKIEVKKVTYQRKTIALEISWKTIDTLEDLPNHPLYADVLGLGVSDKVCRDIFSKYDDDRIMRNLALTKSAHKNKKVDQPAAYFVSAVKEDYADPELPFEGISKPATPSPREHNDRINRDHPLYDKCASDQEFLKLLEAEKSRGEPFDTYNEFHNFIMHGKFAHS